MTDKLLKSWIGKAVSKTLAEKEQMTVRPKQAKVVLNKRNGNTKEAYRNSMKAVDYYKNFLIKCAAALKWVSNGAMGRQRTACLKTVTNISMGIKSVPLD